MNTVQSAPAAAGVLNQALEGINAATAPFRAVRFVLHFWMPFQNLGMSGLKFPSVKSEWIHGYGLIPIITEQQKLNDTVINERNNRVVPTTIDYLQTATNSIIDLIRRYGRYGLLEIKGASCDVGEVAAICEGFALGMVGYSGKLQDLCQYLGMINPASPQLDSPVYQSIGTFESNLSQAYKDNRVPQYAYNKLVAALPEIRNCAVVAVNASISTSGLLLKSIADINAGEKTGWDGTDLWIMDQFPAFNADRRLTGTPDTTGTNRLIELLASKLGATQPAETSKPRSLAETLAYATAEDIAALRKLLLGTDESASAPAEPPASSVDTGATDSPFSDEYPEADEVVEEPGPTVLQCSGRTKSSGYTERCRNDARPGKQTCIGHSSQEPQE